MKTAAIAVALCVALGTTGALAQSNTGKSSTSQGSSGGLQKSNKGGATSGGTSNGMGSIGSQRGSKSGKSVPSNSPVKSTNRKKIE